jgi:hypothetical protein
VDDFNQQNSYHLHQDMWVMRQPITRVGVVALLLTAICVAQDPSGQESLGDIARRERARKEAARASARPELGGPPAIAVENEIIPAHFLRLEGEVAPGELLVLVNGQPVIRNTRIPDLPPYVSPLLRDGGNVLGVQFTSSPNKPLDITIEERFPNEKTHAVLVRFHANANEFPAPTSRQLTFIAHPTLLPPIQLTDADKQEILKLVQTFYDTLVRKDGAAVLALFAPAIEEARAIYPEGANFGQKAMESLASFSTNPEIVMQAYDPFGVEVVPNRRVVSVRRTDGTPVFTSNEVASGGSAAASRVSADVILAKKIKGQWRLTLPFGF